LASAFTRSTSRCGCAPSAFVVELDFALDGDLLVALDFFVGLVFAGEEELERAVERGAERDADETGKVPPGALEVSACGEPGPLGPSRDGSRSYPGRAERAAWFQGLGRTREEAHT
jgi:hypothetical protein